MIALQLKLARVALGLTVRQAAEKCGVSHDTITRIEAGRDLKENTIGKVQAALEAAGVEFIPENGGGPGVRLKKRGATDHPKPAGPATDAFAAMEDAVEQDKGTAKRGRGKTDRKPKA